MDKTVKFLVICLVFVAVLKILDTSLAINIITTITGESPNYWAERFGRFLRLTFID